MSIHTEPAYFWGVQSIPHLNAYAAILPPVFDVTGGPHVGAGTVSVSYQGATVPISNQGHMGPDATVVSPLQVNYLGIYNPNDGVNIYVPGPAEFDQVLLDFTLTSGSVTLEGLEQATFGGQFTFFASNFADSYFLKYLPDGAPIPPLISEDRVPEPTSLPLLATGLGLACVAQANCRGAMMRWISVATVIAQALAVVAAALLALAGPAWAAPTYSGTFTTANQLFWFQGTVNANNVFQEASLTTLAPPGGALMALSGWQSEPAGCWLNGCGGLFANDFAGNGPGNNFSVSLTSGIETEIVFAIGWLGNGPLDNSLFDPFYHPDGFNHFDPLATPFAHDGQPEWTGGTCQGAFCGGNCNGVACNSNATDGGAWAFTTSGVDNIVELSASPSAVPEPTSGVLFPTGLGLMALLTWRRQQRQLS
jgi:hypothetical protein